MKCHLMRQLVMLQTSTFNKKCAWNISWKTFGHGHSHKCGYPITASNAYWFLGWCPIDHQEEERLHGWGNISSLTVQYFNISKENLLFGSILQVVPSRASHQDLFTKEVHYKATSSPIFIVSPSYVDDYVSTLCKCWLLSLVVHMCISVHFSHCQLTQIPCTTWFAVVSASTTLIFIICTPALFLLHSSICF